MKNSMSNAETIINLYDKLDTESKNEFFIRLIKSDMKEHFSPSYFLDKYHLRVTNYYNQDIINKKIGKFFNEHEALLHSKTLLSGINRYTLSEEDIDEYLEPNGLLTKKELHHKRSNEYFKIILTKL